MNRTHPDTERGQGISTAQAGWLTRLLFRALTKRIGVVPKSKRITAHHTGALLASTWMDAVTESATTVPYTLKKLAQLKVAARVGCPF